jgi:hypothetical protein
MGTKVHTFRLFLPLLAYKNPEHFCVQLMRIVSDSRMNIIEQKLISESEDLKIKKNSFFALNL